MGTAVGAVVGPRAAWFVGGDGSVSTARCGDGELPTVLLCTNREGRGAGVSVASMWVSEEGREGEGSNGTMESCPTATFGSGGNCRAAAALRPRLPPSWRCTV